MRKILIVDTRNVIRKGGNSVLIRHIEYGEALKLVSGGKFELNIFDKSGIHVPQEMVAEEYQHNRQTKNQIQLTLQLIRLLRRDKSISLLVCGDPWMPTIISIIARCFASASVPLQVQVHGDIGNEKWRTHSPMNFLKYLVARISLQFAANVRAVGRQQSLNLAAMYRLKEDMITVIPVQPSFFGEIKVKHFQIDRPNIGFVGRIQKERSYKKLIWILEILASDGNSFSLQIIGDGPGIDKLKKTIETRLPKVPVIYSGWLDGEALEREFSKIDILISTAEFESYGRSIREAEMIGIPVLAVRSSGVIDAAFDSKTHLINIIEPDDLRDEILEKYSGVIHQVMNFNHEKPTKGIIEVKSFHNTSSELARLWITL